MARSRAKFDGSGSLTINVYLGGVTVVISQIPKSELGKVYDAVEDIALSGRHDDLGPLKNLTGYGIEISETVAISN
jgi:hypothetical protein